MGSLSNLYISQSYQSLIHLATNNTASAALIGLEDGLGNAIGVSVNTAGNLYLSGTFSASLQEGYLYVGNASGRTIAFPTSSLVTNINTGSLVTTSSFNAYTASTNIRLSNIELTTASVLVSISNLNQYTQSNDTKWSNLAAQSGSWITESETGSFARWDVNNPWSAPQTFTTISASNALITNLHTVYETSSVIYSSGSNQFGDELTDTQILSGSVFIRGGLTINGLDVTASLNSINTFTASTAISITNLNSFTQSANVSFTNLNSATASLFTSASLGLTTASLSGQILTFTKGNNSTFAITIPDVSGSDISALNQATASLQSFTASAAISITNLNSFTASANSRLNNLEAATSSYAISASVAAVDAAQQAQINSLIAATGSYVTETESGSFLITASFNNGTRNLTFTKGDASTFAVNIPDVSGSTIDTGSFATTGSNTFYGSQTISGSVFLHDNGIDVSLVPDAIANGLLIGNNVYINGTLTGSLQEGYVWVGNGSGRTTAVATSSIIANTDTSSLLVTASANLNTITFTKGDASTFNITVNTGSATDITSLNAFTASQYVSNSFFATTGSNTFFGSETFNVSPSDVFRVNWGSASSASLYTENSGGPNQTLNLTSASLYINRGGLFFSSGSFTVQTGDMQFNSYPSASFTIRTQYGGDAVLRSNSDYTNFNLPYAYFRATPNGGAEIIGFGNNVVISGSGTTIQGVDFIPFSASLDTRINSITGSTINTGSLLVTASFNAGTITFTKGDGSTFPLSSFATLGANQFTGNQEILNNSQLIFGNGFSLRGNATDIAQISAQTSIQFITEPPAGPGGTNDIKFINRVSGSQIIFQNQNDGGGNNITFEGGDVLFKLNQISGSLGKVRFGAGLSTAPTSIDAQYSTFTASLQSGYVWIGNGSNVSTTVLASTLAGATFSKPSVETISGSLLITANTFNSGSANILHLSASAQNQANLVFKNNNNTADTIISGSNNIYVNPAAPTAGFKRFIGGNNHFLAQGAVPQMSASMAFPITMESNVFGGTMIMRGPASSSTWTLNNNQGGGTVNIGSSAANNAQRIASGLTLSGNNILGTLNMIASGTADLAGPISFSTNVLAGSATLTAIGSAIAAANNFINDSNTTITNNYYSSSIGLGNISVNRNNFAGQNQTMFVSGALPAGATPTGPSYSDNAMFGGNNTIFTNVSAAPISASATMHSAIRNLIAGHQLIVTGSSALGLTDTYGSAFVGRWNANDGIRNKTAQNILVVGTGKNNTDRKTGFLIDSGSNSYFEGTLNVSGSLSVTGSARGNVQAITIAASTASLDFDVANYFTLTLADTATTHITATNIKPGTTATLVITTGTNSSASLAPTLLQPSGSAYAATNGSGKVDVLSLVSVGTSNAYVVSTLNMI